MTFMLEDFVRENNRIEDIHRDPTWQEIDAHEQFLALDMVMLQDLERFVSVCQPGAKLRSEPGMNVRVGGHTPPEGGPVILAELSTLISWVNGKELDPHPAHIRYETIHPFMDGNGRSGRVLWLWMMGGVEKTPLGFLHHFYYQTLAATR